MQHPSHHPGLGLDLIRQTVLDHFDRAVECWCHLFKIFICLCSFNGIRNSSQFVALRFFLFVHLSDQEILNSHVLDLLEICFQVIGVLFFIKEDVFKQLA